MRHYCTTLFFLCSSSITGAFAWVTPADASNRRVLGAPLSADESSRRTGTSAWITSIPAAWNRRVPTRLAAESSRRQWFSQVGAAVVALSAPTAAQAATSTRPEKPVSPAVCDTAVTVWTNPENGRRVYILGTAHISSQSANVAGKLVRDVKPDAVFVELDAKRVGRAGSIVTPTTSAASNAVPGSAMLSTAPPVATAVDQQQEAAVQEQQQSRPSSLLPKFDIRQRALQAGSAAVGGAIKGMYSKLNSSGFNAGEEFVVAVREGQKIGAAIVLGDRDVEVTLRRLTEALAQTDLKELMNPDSELEQSMAELLPGKPPSPDMGDEEFRQEMSSYVETMKAKDNVRKIMKELKKAAPAIYAALVEERDIYMGQGLDSLNQFQTTVAVMGIAHMEGVEDTLQRLGWRQVPMKCPKA